MDAKWTRLWLGLFVAVVFLTGVGTGVVLDRWRAGPSLVAPPFSPGPVQGPGARMGRGMGPGAGRGLGMGPAGGRGMPGGRGPGPGMLANRLTADLKLTEDQRAKIERILEERRARMEQFYGDVRSRFEAEQRDLRGAIRGVLTAEQQQRFDEWLRWNPLGPPPGRGF